MKKILIPILVVCLIVPCMFMFAGCSGNLFGGNTETKSIDGKDGKDGITPHIGTNGNWWIGTNDTGISAVGKSGTNGTNGIDGLTPYIGENGNWWIGNQDSGVTVSIELGADINSFWDLINFLQYRIEYLEKMHEVTHSEFAVDSWQQIALKSSLGIASELYNIGDEKIIELTTGEQITLVILGFDHDDLADGNGKAGITIGMKDVLQTSYQMNTTKTNYYGWKESAMRNSILPSIFETLPLEMQAVIKNTTKLTRLTSGGNDVTTDDKLFLLSRKEINGAGEYDGSQYAYYSDKTNPYDFIKNKNGTASSYWLRTADIPYPYNFYGISSSGAITTYEANQSTGVSFAFCI